MFPSVRTGSWVLYVTVLILLCTRESLQEASHGSRGKRTQTIDDGQDADKGRRRTRVETGSQLGEGVTQVYAQQEPMHTATETDGQDQKIMPNRVTSSSENTNKKKRIEKQPEIEEEPAELNQELTGQSSTEVRDSTNGASVEIIVPNSQVPFSGPLFVPEVPYIDVPREPMINHNIPPPLESETPDSGSRDPNTVHHNSNIPPPLETVAMKPAETASKVPRTKIPSLAIAGSESKVLPPLDTGQRQTKGSSKEPAPSQGTTLEFLPKSLDVNVPVFQPASTDGVKLTGRKSKLNQGTDQVKSTNAKRSTSGTAVNMDGTSPDGKRPDLDQSAVGNQQEPPVSDRRTEPTNNGDVISGSSQEPEQRTSKPTTSVETNDTTLNFAKRRNNAADIATTQKNEQKKSRMSKPLNLISYNKFVKALNSNASDISNKTHIQQLNHLKEKQKESLKFLKNATAQADAIHNTLKTHKLKLKSYMEVLKNLTLEHAENKKIVTEYTQSVRNKVSDILNPKRRLENHTKSDRPASSSAKQHFLAKNITETLRARVDMDNLKKSEAFWDKKGQDVEEPHMLKDALHFENTMVNEEAYIGADNQLSGVEVSEEYTSRDRETGHIDTGMTEESRETKRVQRHNKAVVDFQGPTTLDDMSRNAIETTTGAQENTTVAVPDPLDDIQKAKLEEIEVTRNRLSGRTGHESLVFNQVVSGRIHGNILAPPPERCSVQSNMKRYRPPEAEMVADDSLLYRVDLEPEFEKALEGGPMNYLPDYKNPCWLSKITDDRGSLWYDYTESGLTYKRMSFLYEMRLSKDSNWRMRCLPLLYFVGVTKSGTTDLYTRLLGHPEVMRPAHKEPMWWNRLTLGMAQSLRKPFRYYLDFFDEAAELMRRKVMMKDGKPYHPGITVDATPANLWDYDCWTDIPGNRGLSEPKYTLAHSIKKLVPGAKILMILREPTDRLYSQYRMKSHREPSYTFHRQVLETIVNFNECLQTRTLRSCAYDHDLSKHEFGSPGGVFIRASLYYVFVKDWLEVFPPEQVKVIRSEDYHNDTSGTLQEVFDFLELSPVTKERMTAISKQRDVNTRADHLDRSMEPILPETQRLLDEFFRPYNKMLARLLHDKRFKWNDVRGPARK